MTNSTKIFAGVSITTLAVIGAIKGISFYNKAKNAINNIQFLFSFVRVQGLIGEGITRFTNPIFQVIFFLEVKNLSDFNIDATNIVATIQESNNSLSWNTIAISDNQFKINVPARGGSSKTQMPINFKGFSTIKALANMSGKKYRALITYRYKGASLQYIQDIPLQQHIKLAIDSLKIGLNLKGIDVPQSTLVLAG